MTYLRVSISKWKVDLTAAEGEEVIRLVDREGIPLLRQQPGFVRYQGMIPDAHTAITIFEWASEEQAEAGQPAWAAWVQRSLAQHLDGPIQAYVGEVRVVS